MLKCFRVKLISLVVIVFISLFLHSAFARRAINVKNAEIVHSFIEAEVKTFVNLMDNRKAIPSLFKYAMLNKASNIHPYLGEGFKLLIEGFEEVDGEKLRKGEELLVISLKEQGFTFDIAYEFRESDIIFFRFVIGEVLNSEIYKLKSADKTVEVLYAKKLLASKEAEHMASYCSEVLGYPVVIFDWAPKDISIRAGEILKDRPEGISTPFEIAVRASWKEGTDLEKIEKDIYESLKYAELQNWINVLMFKQSLELSRESQRLVMEFGGALGMLVNTPVPLYCLYMLSDLGADYTEGVTRYDMTPNAVYTLLRLIGQRIPNIDVYFSSEGVLTQTGFLQALIELGSVKIKHICQEIFDRILGRRMVGDYLIKLK